MRQRFVWRLGLLEDLLRLLSDSMMWSLAAASILISRVPPPSKQWKTIIFMASEQQQKSANFPTRSRVGRRRCANQTGGTTRPDGLLHHVLCRRRPTFECQAPRAAICDDVDCNPIAHRLLDAKGQQDSECTGDVRGRPHVAQHVTYTEHATIMDNEVSHAIARD